MPLLARAKACSPSRIVIPNEDCISPHRHSGEGRNRFCTSAFCPLASERRAFTLLRRARYFSFACPKEKCQEKTTPRLALAGHRATAPALPQLGHPCPRHARQVREPGPCFSTAHPCAGEKESASCRFPLRGLSSPTHRRTGAPIEQRAIVARTFQKSQSKAEPERPAADDPKLTFVKFAAGTGKRT